MPYIKNAPIGINPPSMPGDLIVEYKQCHSEQSEESNRDPSSSEAKDSSATPQNDKKGYFDIKWSDPFYITGKTFIRLWVNPPWQINTSRKPTTQAIIPCGKGHYRLEGFLSEDKVLPVIKGRWFFYIDVVSQFGLKSATSKIVMVKV